MEEANDCVYAILGATGGIGGEVAREVARAGAKLAVAGRNKVELDRVASDLGASADLFDANDWDRIEQFLQSTRERYGRLDGVVHCVGSLLLKPAHLTSREEWENVVSTNLSSAFGVVRAATKLLDEGGSIVLVSSAAAQRGLANHEAIAAAKAGVIGLTLSTAATYAPRGIRVNCVAPGLVDTPMTASIISNPLARKISLAMIPLQQLGDPSDVAGAITWLLHPRQKWITGQVLGVDGGLASLSTKPKA